MVAIAYTYPVIVWDVAPKYMVPEEPLKSFRPRVTVEHDCQTVSYGGGVSLNREPGY
jgi:hypothetical protein